MVISAKGEALAAFFAYLTKETRGQRLEIGKYAKYLKMQSTLLNAERQWLSTCKHQGIFHCRVAFLAFLVSTD